MLSEYTYEEEKLKKGGGKINYNNRMKKIRRKTRSKIKTLPRQKRKRPATKKVKPNKIRTRNQIISVSSTLKNKRKTFFFISIPIAIFISLIVIIPTFIVQIANSNEKPVNEEQVKNELAFTKDHIQYPLIEVSIQRSETEQIETIPLEQYVASVVASEMPAQFQIDALKAQAIAARTYIVNHLLHDENEFISDTTEHQVYRNKTELQSLWGADFYWKWEKITRAVAETENLILTYEREPITPTFFSMSNGYTEDAEHYWGNELPYLKSVESKWEEELPNFKSQTIFTTAELNKQLQTNFTDGSSVPIKIKRTPSNRISEVQLADKRFSGRTIREKLNLRSTDFTIEQKNNHFIFTTKGYGHGVGMSQYGANGMAEEGKTYDEILTYYYQDIEITDISDGAPSLVATNK